MRHFSDLHVHSRFSRATSRSLSVPVLHAWGARKGLGLLGTGDCVHPGWLDELERDLEEDGEGLYRLRGDLRRELRSGIPDACSDDVRFVPQTEISLIYKAGDRTRKVHNLVLLPDLGAARRLSRRLAAIGNVESDGRPILGLDSRDLLEVVLEVDDRAMLIPAHVWTPWFSMLGSRSGFDSPAECFRDLSEHVTAVETGLSSDPEMNWRVPALDGCFLISCSDAHSPDRLGREATVLEGTLSWRGLRAALTKGDGLAGTLEFYPEEGKYHLDGHRKCGVRLTPEETQALKGLCPVCGAPLTVGVLSRVCELAGRPAGQPAPKARPSSHLLALDAILSLVTGRGRRTKTVGRALEALLSSLGPELYVLTAAPEDALSKVGGAKLARVVMAAREGRVEVSAGYDGEYGQVSVTGW